MHYESESCNVDSIFCPATAPSPMDSEPTRSPSVEPSMSPSKRHSRAPRMTTRCSAEGWPHAVLDQTVFVDCPNGCWYSRGMYSHCLAVFDAVVFGKIISECTQFDWVELKSNSIFFIFRKLTILVSI